MPETSEFQPVMVSEVELSTSLPAISNVNPQSGVTYARAICLVRLHTQPVGIVDVYLGTAGLDPDELAEQIWRNLQAEILEHLRRDGLSAITALSAAGIPASNRPRCLQQRDSALENAPFASIVVATHNRTESLSATLNSLLDQDYPNYEIIVVDNAPASDDTATYVREVAETQPHVRYVREARPGLAVAHNRGLEEVRGTFVAFTDDDVIADRHWLAELVRGLAHGDNVACVTGLIFPGELETPAQLLCEQYGGFAKGFAPQIFDLDKHRLNSPLYPYAVGPLGSGANMAFKTSVLRELNGFDPALGAGSLGVGGDDLAAFYQIITNGYQLVYQPSAIVHHWDPRDYAALRRRAYGYGVGLTAYLTKCMLERPWLIFDVALRVPFGLHHLLVPQSQKNKKKRANYPKELDRIERKGMLFGPIAYLRSRRQARKLTEPVPMI